MKLISTSFAALTLSAIDARGTYWWNNNRATDEVGFDHPSYKPDNIDWNTKTRGNVYNNFNKSPQPEGFEGYSPEFYNAYKTASRPSAAVVMHNTQKVKVRVAIQYNCKHLPTITSVQQRINKDHLVRSLVTKQFAAIHVNRFSCNTPMELYADFVFYVYNSEKNKFDSILNTLKPSLCRAVGVRHSEMAKSIRILPEQEIINEAVNQVSTSISKAIADIGQDDVADIIDLAVNNIIELDTNSVNNIVDDLVSVINVDRDEVVNELVNKVEDQIKITLTNTNNQVKDKSDDAVKVIAETISHETTNILGNIPTIPITEEETKLINELDLFTPSEDQEDLILDINEDEDQNISESDISSFDNQSSEESDLAIEESIINNIEENNTSEINDEDIKNLVNDINIEIENEGNLNDFMPIGFETADESTLNNIITNEIQGEENDLKSVLFNQEELNSDMEEPKVPSKPAVSAKEIASEIGLITVDEPIIEIKDTSSDLYHEIEATQAAREEFKQILIEASQMPSIEQEDQNQQIIEDNNEDIEEPSSLNSSMDSKPISPVVDQILTINENSIRENNNSQTPSIAEIEALEDNLDFNMFEDVSDQGIDNNSDNEVIESILAVENDAEYHDDTEIVEDVEDNILTSNEVLNNLINEIDINQVVNSILTPEELETLSTVTAEDIEQFKQSEVDNGEVISEVSETDVNQAILELLDEQINKVAEEENEKFEMAAEEIETEKDLIDNTEETEQVEDNKSTIENIIRTIDNENTLENSINNNVNSTAIDNINNNDTISNKIINTLGNPSDTEIPADLINQLAMNNVNTPTNSLTDGLDHGIMEEMVETVFSLFGQ
jgi:hypothetical protein